MQAGYICREVTSAEQRLLAELTDKEQAEFRRLLTKVACASNVSQEERDRRPRPRALDRLTKKCD